MWHSPFIPFYSWDSERLSNFPIDTQIVDVGACVCVCIGYMYMCAHLCVCVWDVVQEKKTSFSLQNYAWTRPSLTGDCWAPHVWTVYMVWVTLWCLCKWLKPVWGAWSQRVAFLWRDSRFPSVLLPIRKESYLVVWLGFFWPTWPTVSFEGCLQSWPHKRQW